MKERRDGLNFKTTEKNKRMTCGLVKLERGEGAGFYGKNWGSGPKSCASPLIRRMLFELALDYSRAGYS
jgi:hypothetical protein